MKKIMFISTFLGVFILNTLICSAAPTPDKFDPVKIDLGTIDADFSWPLQDYKWPKSQDNTYRLSFKVDSAGLNLTINSTKSMKIWFFNATDKTWSSFKDGNWTKMFAAGSYTLDIYGETTALKTTALKATAYMPSLVAVPIPGAMILLGSGIFGLFLVRRSKQILA